MIDLLQSEITLTIALIVALGVSAQWLAWRMNLPAILPLLVTGFIVGPLLGWIRPAALVPPQLLFPTISLAVGLILFEGGLTLRLPEIKEIRGVVLRLVSVGALISFIGGTAAAYLLTPLSLPLSFLFGSLIIVTGPTVIGPLLRIVRPNARVANILKWEGIIIDAVGALVAVLVFEFVRVESATEALGHSLLLILEFAFFGALLGAVGGLLMSWILKQRLLPDYLINIVTLAAVFLVFAVANTLEGESGLLATIIMGMILGNSGAPRVKEILSFKEDMTILFISLLFVVLAANIELDAFLSVLSLSSLALLAVVMLVLRPLGVFASTAGSPLQFNEKLFLSWIAPRGIVAASVSSLFAARLADAGFPGAQALVSLVFLVIVGTVLLNSLTARILGQRLGVALPDPQGFLIVGANPAARRIAGVLQDAGVQVLLADTNWGNVVSARADGLSAYYGSLLSERSDDEVRLGGMGKLLALTSNDEANSLTALKYARLFGSQAVYQLEPSREASERNRIGGEQRGVIVFRRGVSYRELNRLFEQGWELQTLEVDGEFSYEELARRFGGEVLPMFVLDDGNVKVLTTENQQSTPVEGTRLVVLAPRVEAARQQAALEV